jgi:hypothetical protein
MGKTALVNEDIIKMDHKQRHAGIGFIKLRTGTVTRTILSSRQ